MIIDTFTAISLDGVTGKGRKGDGKIFTEKSSPAIIKLREKIRNNYQAILVGANTILNDNPRLLNTNSTNKRIIIDIKNNLPLDRKIFLLKPQNTILLTRYKKNKKGYFQKLSVLGVKIYFLNNPKNLFEVTKKLRGIGIKSISIEGGPKTINLFLKAKLIENLQVIIFPILVGGDKLNFFHGAENTDLKIIKQIMIEKKYIFIKYHPIYR